MYINKIYMIYFRELAHVVVEACYIQNMMQEAGRLEI